MNETHEMQAQWATELVELAIKMREAQRKYFLTRERADLVAAKQLEREFDQRAK